MTPNAQDGLQWDNTGLQLVPLWTREPSLHAIEAVCRRQRRIASEEVCAVSFYASGAFNKLYLVSFGSDKFLMRVSLPVYPQYKTRGEVATLQWVRENTNIPVPKIIAFLTSSDNETGFEWILMELMPGAPAYRRWRNMSMEQKTVFTERIADFQAQLSARPGARFNSIGALRPDDFVPDRVVSHEFFMGDHVHYDVPRGPFSSSHAWLSSVLQIVIQAQTAAAEKAEDEDDKEDALDILSAARKLLSLLPKIFPPFADAEPTALWHDDLNLNNILVDESGAITGVVDWECVSALPLWMAARPPAFLSGGGREEEPRRNDYADADPEVAITECDGLDNEGENELYWIHLMQYEVTQLQKVYDAKLAVLWPNHPLEESALKVDFYEAVLQCIAGIWLKKVNKWVDCIDRGEIVRWGNL
ncbi:phosphotransferase enzyme family-domain-containing protein [Mycena pura]|uniref:Phosphotransferase enzyme family-domain-containing protein n=1 Tax=Mycena pura TaxID=153505 RepID=A0AAD6VR03_9AGAR|nr:phosphotransferase enzyme family-domain-containing protein [Mycena pura]